MGSDDLFHRKKKGASALKRRAPRRQLYDRVLIVTEGQRTEPNYLLELIKSKKLHTANVVVDGDCGSDPMSIYKHAKDLYKTEKKRGEKFDRVYCVFDQDGHTNYVQALDAIRRAVPKGVYHAINSVPCFEYWVLLHFQYTMSIYQAPGGQSSYRLLLKDLKKHLPDYEKGEVGLYQRLEDKLDIAIVNAKKGLAAAEAVGTDNPTTRMHLLVEYLHNLKK